jgi:hypothetical protein
MLFSLFHWAQTLNLNMKSWFTQLKFSNIFKRLAEILLLFLLSSQDLIMSSSSHYFPEHESCLTWYSWLTSTTACFFGWVYHFQLLLYSFARCQSLLNFCDHRTAIIIIFSFSETTCVCCCLFFIKIRSMWCGLSHQEMTKCVYECCTVED